MIEGIVKWKNVGSCRSSRAKAVKLTMLFALSKVGGSEHTLLRSELGHVMLDPGLSLVAYRSTRLLVYFWHQKSLLIKELVYIFVHNEHPLCILFFYFLFLIWSGLADTAFAR